MTLWDERKLKKKKTAYETFLEDNFEDPTHSDILIEKQVKEDERKR